MGPTKTIEWTSDYSIVKSGWKICGVNITTTTTTLPVGGPALYTVTLGVCRTTPGGSCVQSPNYPNNYGNKQTCKISIAWGNWTGKAINVTSFATEYAWDKLRVNG